MLFVNKIKTIKNITVLFNRGIVNCHDYLEKGRYKITPSLTTVYNDKACNYSKTLHNQLFGNTVNNNKYLQIFTKFLSKYICNNGKMFQGQMVILSTNGNDYKIFDFNSEAMLTLFGSQDTADKVIDNRKKWSKFFSTNNFKRISDTCTVESILKQSISKHDDLFMYILEDYKEYFKVAEYSDSTIDTILLDKFVSDFDLTDHIKTLFANKFKFCMTHGDLWSSNIINNMNRHYYIDFENVGLRVFYFDIFMYMFSEELILNDETLLTKYFYGEFDAIFTSLFDIIGEKYNKHEKHAYFICFLYSLYLDRWNGQQSTDTTEKVKEILKKYLRCYNA